MGKENHPRKKMVAPSGITESLMAKIAPYNIACAITNEQGSGGSRIFLRGGALTPKMGLFFQLFAENCMKMKEFGPPGGARVPGAPP